jgi:hypothetical protein
MEAIVASGHIAQPQQLPIVPQDNRTADVAKPIFQRLKDTALRVWNFVVTVVAAAFGKVNFLFFRVLGFIHPTWALKAEVAFLRLSQAIQNGWSGEAQQADELRVQNQDLRLRLRNLEHADQLNANLTQERDDLQAHNQRLTAAHAFLDQRVNGLLQQHQHQAQQVNAINDDRNLILQERDLLGQQRDRLNIDLVLQRNEAQVAQQAAVAAAQEQARAQVQQLEQQIPLLEEQLNAIQVDREIDQRFRQAFDAAKQVLLRPNNQKTELDDFLEFILPQLVSNISEIRQRINDRAPRVAGTAQETADRATDLNLARVTEGLQKFLPLFALHRDYRNDLLLVQQNLAFVQPV